MVSVMNKLILYSFQASCQKKNFLKKPIVQKPPPEVFCDKGILKNFAKFTGKHLFQSLFFNKVTDHFAKTLRTPFSQNTSGRLLLNASLNLILSSSKEIRSKFKEKLKIIEIV